MNTTEESMYSASIVVSRSNSSPGERSLASSEAACFIKRRSLVGRSRVTRSIAKSVTFGLYSDPVDYDLLSQQVRALLEDESDFIANCANFSAFVGYEIPDLNWAGFYFAQPDGELVLGPFFGKPACTRLAPGRGVCGKAYTSEETVVVDDVHQFSDHIACDSASRSEIV